MKASYNEAVLDRVLCLNEAGLTTFSASSNRTIDATCHGAIGQYVFVHMISPSLRSSLTMCEVQVYSSKAFDSIVQYNVATSLDGVTFNMVMDGGQPRQFEGNVDKDTPSLSVMEDTISSQYVRLFPTQCKDSCAARIEVLGGPTASCQSLRNTPLSGEPIRASDEDGLSETSWTDLSYKITAGNVNDVFCIKNPKEAILYICNPETLDFETRSDILLEVSVSDNGTPPLSDKTSVRITISDMNEPPQLDPCTRPVDENSAAGSIVGSPLTGFDNDFGQSDTLLYKIINDDSGGLFDITERGQLKVSLNASNGNLLNYENINLFNVTVQVIDEDGLKGEGTVTIQLSDLNEASVFPNYIRSVNESSLSGTAVGIPVLSFDEDGGVFGTPAYSITHQYVCPLNLTKACQISKFEIFSINPVSGQISVYADLDEDGDFALNFEDKTYFKLVIQSADIGMLFSFSETLVYVLDINEKPIFHDLESKHQSAFSSFTTVIADQFGKKMRGGYIMENAIVGTKIGRVAADSVDIGDELRYFIINGDPSGLFGIDSDGTIRLRKANIIDYENVPSYTIVVHTEDTYGLSDDTTFVINVEDINEAPAFHNSYSGRVKENDPVDTKIGAPILGADEDRVAVRGNIDFWSDVQNNVCVMQWGKAPFTRAGSVKKESVDIGTPSSIGLIKDISLELDVINSHGLHAAKTNSRPTISTVFRKSYEHLGCWKFDNVLELNVLVDVEISGLVDGILKCADAAKAKGFDMFAIRRQKECLVSLQMKDGVCDDVSNKYCYKRYGRSERCSRGRGNEFEVDIYKTLKFRDVSTSCAALKSESTKARNGMVSLSRDSSASTTFCDQSVDGGGWSLVAVAPESFLGQSLENSYGRYDPLRTSRWISEHAGQLIEESDEIVLSWNEMGSSTGGINSYENAVKFSLPSKPNIIEPVPEYECASEGGTCQCFGTVKYGHGKNWETRRSNGQMACSNQVFGDPKRGTKKACFCIGSLWSSGFSSSCSSDTWSSVDVTCLYGNCSMPSKMYISSTLGTDFGKSLGLVKPQSTSSSNNCNIAIREVSSAVYIGVLSDLKIMDVGVFNSHGDHTTPTIAIWARQLNAQPALNTENNDHDKKDLFWNPKGKKYRSYPGIKKKVHEGTLSGMSVAFFMKAGKGFNNPATVFSYATGSTDNEFLLYDNRNMHVYFKGSRINGGKRKLLTDDKWHAVCLSWGTDKLSGKRSVVLYIDNHEYFRKTVHSSISGNGVIFIGQEQDSSRGNHRLDRSQQFYGRLNRLNVYRRHLSTPGECMSTFEGNEEGDLLSWKEIIEGETTINNAVSSDSLWVGREKDNLEVSESTNDFNSIVDNRILIGRHYFNGVAGTNSDLADTFLDIGSATGKSYHISNVDIENGNKGCGRVALQRLDSAGNFVNVLESDLDKTPYGTSRLGDYNYGIDGTAPSPLWRLLFKGDSGSAWCSVMSIRVYGNENEIPLWHGKLVKKANVDSFYNDCVDTIGCIGFAMVTSTRGRLVSAWSSTPLLDAYGNGISYETHRLLGHYDHDPTQSNKGVRLGDCLHGELSTEVSLPYLSDWHFEFKSIPDYSKGSSVNDYIDAYVDGKFVARHLNDGVHQTSVRVNNVQNFNVRFELSSSNRQFNTHMKIETGEVATSFIPGEQALSYELAGPACAKGSPLVSCPLNMFKIDAVSGQLSLKTANTLNVAIHDSYELVVVASDPHGLKALTNIEIRIIQSNDKPVMESRLLFVDENARSVELSQGVACTDTIGVPPLWRCTGSASDHQKGQKLTYRIAAGNQGNTFSIIAETGLIVVRQNADIDFEKLSTYKLGVTATDDGMGRLEDTNTITISVRDVNEPPWLLKSTKFVNENSGENTRVSGGPVVGFDADAGDSISYRIVGGHENKFYIHAKTGLLYTSDDSLNYESKSKYEILVEVMDRAGLSGKGSVTVDIRDVNDAPRIVKTSGSSVIFQEKLVPEDASLGMPVGSVVFVTDEDTKANWKKPSFEIVQGADPVCSNGLDNQGRVNAWLILGNKEEGAFFYNRREYKNTLVQKSYVGDEEAALAPKEGDTLSSKTWTSYVDNCRTVSSCGMGCNSKGVNLDCHFYGISDGDKFPCSEDVCTREVAYAASYIVTKKARLLELRVSSNDGHTLWFNGEVVASRYTGHCFGASVDDSVRVSLKEGTNTLLIKTQESGGSWGFVVSLSETDGIFATTLSEGNRRKSILGSQLFAIDESTGQISVKDNGSLNFELLHEFILTIRVSDNGGLQHQALILVRVGDVNERPSFNSKEMRHVHENAEGGVAVGDEIGVTEQDSNQQIFFWTFGHDDKFSVNSKTGQINVVDNAVLDFEDVRLYELVVYVRDSAVPPLVHSVPLTISIEDVNEPPSLQINRLFVEEDPQPSFFVVTGGVCLDHNGESTVTTHTCSSDMSQKFTVHSDGRIKTTGTGLCLEAQDNRIVLRPESKDKWKIQKWILPSSEGPICLSALRSVCIGQQGEVSSKVIARWSFVFAPTPGKNIGVPIVAMDQDFGQQKRLSFTITKQSQFDGDKTVHFALDTNGAMRVQNAFLDFEQKISYIVDVRVQDDGLNGDLSTKLKCFGETNGCRLTDSGTFTVEVLNVNEPPTVMDQTRQIEENAYVDALVGAKLEASDVDANDKIKFSIIAGNDEHIFNVESCSGQVRVARSLLDYENKNSHTLVIKVEDEDGLHVTGRVTVHVLDNNESPAVKQKEFSVLENSVEGTLVGSPVPASDLDFSQGGILEYSITGGNQGNIFSIDSSSGQLSLQFDKLNYESRPIGKNGQRSPFVLEITVTDSGFLASQTFQSFADGMHMLPHDVRSLGCFKIDQTNIIELENSKILPPLSKRDNKIQRCAEAIFMKGLKKFVLFEDGRCASYTPTVRDFESEGCLSGLGGPGVMDVYTLDSVPPVVSAESLSVCYMACKNMFPAGCKAVSLEI